MKCIFCKRPSETSSSVEHIIPESLGNKQYILPKGAVCDKCNNYLAREVEKPVLASPMFRFLRKSMTIPNKRGKLPSLESSDIPPLPEYRVMGRFIGKVGLEVLAFKALDVRTWNEELVSTVELDDLRRFVRYNEGEIWEFAFRTLYPVNATFKEGDVFYEVLHEFDVLITNENEFYVVIAVLGVEFVMNLGGRTLDGYHKWLKENNYRSPLYNDKNAF